MLSSLGNRKDQTTIAVAETRNRPRHGCEEEEMTVLRVCYPRDAQFDESYFRSVPDVFVGEIVED